MRICSLRQLAVAVALALVVPSNATANAASSSSALSERNASVADNASASPVAPGLIDLLQRASASARISHDGAAYVAALSTLPVPAGTDKNLPAANGGTAGIGVQTATGNLALSTADIAIDGRGPSLAVGRTYNSNDTYVGPLGIGWTHSYAARLHLADDGSGAVIVVGAQGRRDRYTPLGGGNFSAPAGVTAILTQLVDTTWTLKSKDQTVLAFNADGRLTSITDRYGNASALTYNGSGQLSTVSDPAGRGVLTFAYHPTSGRLTSITDWLTPTARVVTYGYDGSNRLNSVTDRAGGVTQYTYDANSRLATIVTSNK
jgi:YD repeat-containing protein